MNKLATITPNLRKSFAANRAAIAAANAYAFRRAAIRTLMAERDAKIAAAAKSDTPWAELGEELHRIDAEFHTAAAKYRGPLDPRPDNAGRHDPVFDNTVASHSYFGRL